VSTGTGLHPIGGPAAWRGAELVADPAWIVELTDAEVGALIDAVRALPGGPLRQEHRGAIGVPLAALAQTTAAVRRELVDGRGFIVLRGMPVDGLTIEELERAYWVLGLHVGIPVQQTGAGDLLVHVRDEGLDYTDPHVRGYQTCARLDFHVDGSDVVGLLCVRAARSGGISTIVSATAIHDELVARRPDLAELLSRPFWFDRRNGDGPESFYQLPIFGFEDGRFVMYYGRSYLESAQRGPQTDTLDARQLEAFDLVDELANSPELVLPMDLRPGDVQFLNNRTVMHARTAFDDWPEPERKRDMVRLWISLGDGRPAEMVP
jgi:Taurine catabolism dioxygenase TauD, TfdA family